MNSDTIKKDNKKALPKLLATVLLSMIAGGFIGFFSGVFSKSVLSDAVISVIESGLYVLSLWGIPAATAALLIPTLFVYRKAKKLYSGWDGEDEQVADQIEYLLNFGILFMVVLMPLILFFMSACLAYRNNVLIIAAGAVMVSAACIAVMQQKIVDLTRRMNPEKRGSIYDMNFQKKWVDSCDEAERKQIGEAAYKAYLATNAVCVLLWLALFFVYLVFDTGLLAAFMVLFVWGVMQAAYVISCIRQSRKKA